MWAVRFTQYEQMYAYLRPIVVVCLPETARALSNAIGRKRCIVRVNTNARCIGWADGAIGVEA